MPKENKAFWRENRSFDENDESKAKGKRNEHRALVLLEELVAEGVLARVRKASKRQNKVKGIDFMGVVILDGDAYVPTEIQIPIQVKSSPRSARDFVRERELYQDPRITVLIVNDWRPDATIKEAARRYIAGYMRNHTVFPPPE